MHPESGKFTQVDPIGIAGGLNVYGFAEGDPVNYDDPFGLDCKDAKGNSRPCEVKWSTVDRPNKNVNPRVMRTMQEVADAAEVDLVLSSGLRPGDPFNHGKGRAVDISSINGVDIGTGDVTNPQAMPLVEKVQGAANTNPEVRENFGPAGLWKSPARGTPQTNYNDGSAKRKTLQRQHLDHIHISVQP